MTYFVKEMNNIARRLITVISQRLFEFLKLPLQNDTCKINCMSSTYFQNVHGLSVRPNVSTCSDVCKMCIEAQKHEFFRHFFVFYILDMLVQPKNTRVKL